MPKVVHFEIPVDDPERAKAFYTALLGWEITEAMPGQYWLVDGGGPDAAGGVNGALALRQDWQKGEGCNAFVCIIGVEDIDAILGKVADLGGTVANPKFPVPTTGWVAYVIDTEGNRFGLLQPDANAA